MAKIAMERDPEELQSKLPLKAPGIVRILGIDLGTNCGVAWMDFDPNKPLDKTLLMAGQLDLSLGPYDTGPLRHIRLKNFLSAFSPDLVGYEEVKFTPKMEGLAGGPVGVIVARVANAAELLGAFKIIMATWAEERGIPVQGFGIGQIKKYATGKGNANKLEMIKAANKMFQVSIPEADYESTGADNIADAMMVCMLTVETYRYAFKPATTN